MLISILFILFGIALLYYGGEWLVKGSSRLALHLGVAPLVLGLTVVAFGTSAPELVSSLIAQISQGSGSVAVGNVIGSNIYNIGFVLGISALIYPIVVNSSLFRRELPICIGVSALLLFMMWDGGISRADGAILLLCFIGYIAFQFREARRSKEMKANVKKEFEEYTERLEAPVASKLWFHIGAIILGSVMLVIGADFLVRNAIVLARMVGISERVIGLTVVAFGTSLPELATSVIAAMRKEADIAVGNIVGSCIFNILLIVGAVAAIKPLAFDPTLLRIDAPFMLGLTVVMMLLLIRGRKLHKWEGGLLLAAALGYTAFLFCK